MAFDKEPKLCYLEGTAPHAEAIWNSISDAHTTKFQATFSGRRINSRSEILNISDRSMRQIPVHSVVGIQRRLMSTSMKKIQVAVSAGKSIQRYERGGLIHVVLQAAEELNIPLKTNFSHPHSLCQVRFSSLTVEREAEIQAVMQAAEWRHANRIQGERITNPLMAIFSCPGGGKSRFLDLVSAHVLRLGRDSDSCLGGSVVLPISYNGVTGTPSIVDKDNGLSAKFGLAARIIWSYFFQQGRSEGEFSHFCLFLNGKVPGMNAEDALQVVMKHRGTTRVLLLLDELVQSEIIAADRPLEVLSCVGGLLDYFAGFNALVSSLKPSPVLRLQSRSGRPSKWVALPAFTFQESLTMLEPGLGKYAHLGMDSVLRLLVSDVGGHPRGLQVLVAALDQHLDTGMLDGELMTAMVKEFMKFYSSLGPLDADMVRIALKGKPVPLGDLVGGLSVEELMAMGVFLNSEVGEMRTAVIPRLSIMLLRVFAVHSVEMELSGCVMELARTIPKFDFSDMELFHAQWEVLARLVGWAGQRSLADFYRRDRLQRWPAATEAMVIDFCPKNDGVISWLDQRSIFRGFSDPPSCRAVYTAKSGQAGFDMVMFEEKAAGGHVAIFVDTKDSDPRSKTRLKSEEFRDKMALCLKWSSESQACKALGIGPKDCFLVLACWRHGDLAAIQARELSDSESRILVLGRRELAPLYTPTLVSRPQLILGTEVAGET